MDHRHVRYMVRTDKGGMRGKTEVPSSGHARFRKCVQYLSEINTMHDNSNVIGWLDVIVI